MKSLDKSAGKGGELMHIGKSIGHLNRAQRQDNSGDNNAGKAYTMRTLTDKEVQACTTFVQVAIPKLAKLSNDAMNEAAKAKGKKPRESGSKGTHAVYGGFNRVFGAFLAKLPNPEGLDVIECVKQLEGLKILATRGSRGGPMVFLYADRPTDRKNFDTDEMLASIEADMKPAAEPAPVASETSTGAKVEHKQAKQVKPTGNGAQASAS